MSLPDADYKRFGLSVLTSRSSARYLPGVITSRIGGHTGVIDLMSFSKSFRLLKHRAAVQGNVQYSGGNCRARNTADAVIAFSDYVFDPPDC